jgi:hypothetical protein
LEQLIQQLQQNGNLSQHLSSQLIRNTRKSFIKARNTIKDLDKSLYWINFFDFITTIVALMVYIYATIVGAEEPIIKALLRYYILYSIIYVIKLVINCLIHGMVYEKSKNFYLCFDGLDLNVRNLDENGFREAIYLKTRSNDSKFGFTILGIPMRKKTLISVGFIILITTCFEIWI